MSRISAVKIRCAKPLSVRGNKIKTVVSVDGDISVSRRMRHCGDVSGGNPHCPSGREAAIWGPEPGKAGAMWGSPAFGGEGVGPKPSPFPSLGPGRAPAAGGAGGRAAGGAVVPAAASRPPLPPRRGGGGTAVRAGARQGALRRGRRCARGRQPFRRGDCWGRAARTCPSGAADINNSPRRRAGSHRGRGAAGAAAAAPSLSPPSPAPPWRGCIRWG